MHLMFERLKMSYAYLNSGAEDAHLLMSVHHNNDEQL